MKLLGALVAVILALLAVVSLLNWSALVTPSEISLGVTSVQGPLGVVMLASSGLLTVTFLAFILFQQASTLLDVRRLRWERDAHRELAEKAEASRLTELGASLEAEFRKAHQGAAAELEQLLARLDRIEQSLLTAVSQVDNGLSAHLAEVEDKIDTALRGLRDEET